MSLIAKVKSFFADRQDARIARNLKQVKNAKAIREDRWAAIDFFCTLGDAGVAVPALLERFEYSLEHGINDTREKEMALEGIVKCGADALPFIRERLRTTTRIAWPIKALNALGQEKEVIETLKSALNFEDVAFDQSQVDKNYDILCYLRDYKIPEFVEKAVHFLDDADERVRFACVELLLEQDHPAVPGYVEKFLGDTSAENSRIHQAVLEAFVNKKWVVARRDAFKDGFVPPNHLVTPKGYIEARR